MVKTKIIAALVPFLSLVLFDKGNRGILLLEMARVVLKVFALLVVAFCGTEVLGQTHHVFGGDDGWSSDLNVSSWLDGRVFMVGDKICEHLASFFFFFF